MVILISKVNINNNSVLRNIVASSGLPKGLRPVNMCEYTLDLGDEYSWHEQGIEKAKVHEMFYELIKYGFKIKVSTR